MSRFDTVQAWWQARDPRERRMLWLMVAALSAFAWWYALVAPLRHARELAQASHQRAAATLASVQAGVAVLDAQAPGTARPGTREALVAVATDTARAAGVAITRDREGEPGEWVVEIDAVDYAALTAWLERMRLQHRLAPDALHATAESGRLRVQARFRMPAS